MMEYVCAAALFGGAVYGLADVFTFAHNIGSFSDGGPPPLKRCMR